MSKEIIDILNDATGNSIDIYYVLYTEHLLPSKNPAENLEIILQFNGDVGTDSEKESARIKEQSITEIREKYIQLLQSIVRALVQENPTVNEFYGKLYQNVFQSSIFPDDSESKAVLLYFLANEIYEVPYYQAVGLYTVDKDEYSIRAEKLIPQIREAIHMLNRHFKQKTEESSQLCRIASELNDEKDRIVYWSLVISCIRRSILKRAKEEE